MVASRVPNGSRRAGPTAHAGAASRGVGLGTWVRGIGKAAPSRGGWERMTLRRAESGAGPVGLPDGQDPTGPAEMRFLACLASGLDACQCAEHVVVARGGV